MCRCIAEDVHWPVEEDIENGMNQRRETYISDGLMVYDSFPTK